MTTIDTQHIEATGVPGGGAECCALIVQPLGVWNLPAVTLSHVEEHEFAFVTKGKVCASEVVADATWMEVVTGCEQCEPRQLYEAFGKPQFRTEEGFWLRGDKQLQQTVKQAVDGRLYAMIEQAAGLGIHIFFREDGKAELLKKKELTLMPAAAVPLMKFSRSEEGITYTLHLLLERGEEIVPCEHTPLLLTETPCMMLMGTRIYTLPEGFSGKLLLPFLDKPTTFIPRRIQNEYFRRFILKNTYRTEIQAEGFDILEEQCERRCKLLLERNVCDEALLMVQFEYGDVTFDGNDGRKMFVRLEEEEDSFRFVKFVRDEAWESGLNRLLYEELEMPGKDSPGVLIDWLRTHREQLKQVGVQFVQPTDNHYYIGDVEVVRSARWDNDWLRMRIEIHLDNGMVIPFLKLKDSILEGKREYVLDDGSSFFIPDEWFARYGGAMLFGQVDGQELLVNRCQLPVVETAGFEVEGRETERRLPADCSVPQGLKAQLRPYQQIGFEWLYRNFVSRTGCCLSDDMGLGKTVQTIALLMKYKEGGAGLPYETVLVVSPASVVYNWRNEIKRFAPKLTVCEYIGTTETRRQKRLALMRWDVVLTTYQTLRNDIEHLMSFTFGMVVFDESQCFKNRESQLYQSVIRLNTRHRMALSGTPLENSLSDLWSLLNVINPRLLGSHRAFQRNYIRPISQDLQGQKVRMLRMLVAPYFLKRTKEEVLPDLPLRQDELVMCDMTAEQRRLYEEELSCARNYLLADGAAGGGAEASQTSIHVLTAINRLRQIACHPRLVGREGMDSGKFDEIFSRLELLYETEHKVLLFSEYVSLLRLVGEEMERRGWRYEMLIGETTGREAVIDRFSGSPTCHFFLISLKAGGVGLNLTSADYVFLLDPWWNRAAEEQAVSRAHRMGQRRSVFVYRFISCGTLEEDILRLQDRKCSLAEAVLPFILSPAPPQTVSRGSASTDSE
ncbi:MAG: DEAD/DEAH box helicase [Bacteroides sp.]|nr:DEAD/DEAH box helicase [Bacteroides sp.]